MKYLKNNEDFWNEFSRKRGPWSQAASPELIQKAKSGQIELFITSQKLVPKDWIPEKIATMKVLGLAAGGGQQMPILAATGAKVHCVELSNEQIERDLEVCRRENLQIEHHRADISNLNFFENESFDFAINPVSLCYIQDPSKVFSECYRVLKKGSIFICGFDNPVGHSVKSSHELILTHSIPCSDLDKISNLENHQGTIEFGHSLTTLIGGILNAGFVITDFYEDIWGEGFDMPIDKIMPQFLAIRAVKSA